MNTRIRLYTKPIVTAVELDPRQAILVPCKADNGVWMTNGGTACVFLSPAGITTGCATGGRITAVVNGSPANTDTPGS